MPDYKMNNRDFRINKFNRIISSSASLLNKVTIFFLRDFDLERFLC